METTRLKKKIKDVLRKAHFKAADDFIDVSDGAAEGNVHVVIVSRKLEYMEPEQKDALVWNILHDRLSPEEWGRVSLIATTSPEEIKAR